jgi:cytoskeletal protein CcmA (bactofilin family)
MRRFWWKAALAACMALTAALPAAADDKPGDRMVAGGTVSVDQPVDGDLIAAGGRVDVNAAVAGDAVVAGGRVRLGGYVGLSVYAAGGEVNIDGKVERHVRVAGGQVEVGPAALIAGNLTTFGGRTTLRGTVKGDVRVAGGQMLIDGPVQGDVTAGMGRLELGPKARIGGKLHYGGGELKRDPAAQVLGGTEPVPPRSERNGRHDGGSDAEPATSAWSFGLWFWTAGLMLLAAVLLAVLPRFSQGAGSTLRSRFIVSPLAGLGVLLVAPLAIVIAMATIIGLPVALLALAMYLALLPVAYVSAAIGLGDGLVRAISPARASGLGARFIAAALVLAALALAGRIGWPGWLIQSAALAAGLGALVLHAVRRSPQA